MIDALFIVFCFWLVGYGGYLLGRIVERHYS